MLLVSVGAQILKLAAYSLIRRRFLPDEVRMRADKWQQAVKAVDPEAPITGLPETQNDVVDDTLGGVVLTAMGATTGRTLALVAASESAVASVLTPPWPTVPG